MRNDRQRHAGGRVQGLIAGSGAMLLCLAMLAGPVAAASLNHSDIDVRHPPGRLVDIGGYRLHLYCLGQGSPTVVFDSGIGGFSLEWATVQSALAGTTRACTYDRAGYGWSDRSPYPRTTRVMVSELHRLLRAAHEQGPYLLVGHSFGGYNVRYYANAYPDEVAGMVLVDASHPQQFSAFPKRPQPRHVAIPESDRSYTVHVLRPEYPGAYPAAVRQLAFLLMLRRHSAEIQLQELNHFQESAQQVLAQANRFPDIPLIVLSRGKRVWPHSAYGNAMEQVWTSLQHDLLRLSGRSEQVIARHSGHAIHLDQPQLVISSIQQDLQEARWDAVRPNLVSGVNASTLPFQAVAASGNDWAQRR